VTYTHEQLTEAVRIAKERGRAEASSLLDRFAGLNGHGKVALKALGVDEPLMSALPEPPPPYYADALRAEEDAATEYLHQCQRWRDDHPESKEAQAAVSWAESRLGLVTTHKAKAGAE
jgi:hypothetical protein